MAFDTWFIGKGRCASAISMLLLAAACSQPHAFVPDVELQAMKMDLGERQHAIHHYAKLSNAVYLCSDEVSQLESGEECLHASVEGWITDKAFYFIQTDDQKREHTIVIRGTDNFYDVLIDIGVDTDIDEILKVKVHHGFHKFAKAIYEDIKNNHRLTPGYKVTVTGHSLGGAGALLLGLYLYVRDGFDVTSVYTYGQPRVFDNVGATAWPYFARRVFRVVDCADIVPLLPTAPGLGIGLIKVVFLDADRGFDYQHVGQSLILMDEGVFWMPGGVDYERSLMKNIADTVGALDYREKIDHQMTQYFSRLKWLRKDSTPLNPTDTRPNPPKTPLNPTAKVAQCSRYEGPPPSDPTPPAVAPRVASRTP